MAKTEISADTLAEWQKRLSDLTMEIKILENEARKSGVSTWMASTATFISDIARCERFLDPIGVDLRRAIRDGDEVEQVKNKLKQQRERAAKSKSVRNLQE